MSSTTETGWTLEPLPRRYDVTWMDYAPMLPQIEAHARTHGGIWVFRRRRSGGQSYWHLVAEGDVIVGALMDVPRMTPVTSPRATFRIPLQAGRMVSDKWLFTRPGYCQFRPVGRVLDPVPVLKTAGPWIQRSGVSTVLRCLSPFGIARVSAQDTVWGDNSTWMAGTSWSETLEWFASASEAMREMDDRLLRRGYVLEGDVHASPLVNGYRVHPQGFARVL